MLMCGKHGLTVMAISSSKNPEAGDKAGKRRALALD
jgi:hypothetical protein